MKVISNTGDYDHDFMDFGEFYSGTTYLGYDIVIIDFDSILYNYSSITYDGGKFQGLKCLDEHESFRLTRDIARRKKEINEILALGKTLVIFTPYNRECYVYTGKNDISGTGKNAKTTNYVSLLSLLSMLPLEVDTEKAEGKNIEYVGDESFINLWNEFKEYLSYEAYFNTNEGKPLFRISGTKFLVGQIVNVDKGRIIFLPRFNCSNLRTKTEQFNVETSFYKLLLETISNLFETDTLPLPEWSIKFLLPDEKQEVDKLSSLVERVSELNEKIAIQRNQIEKMQQYKLLFTGTGKALENKVKEIFTDLGFTIVNHSGKREDLALVYNNQHIVVEVKGITKSAGERNAAQLEKWVNEYHLAHDILPKGILVANTFKDTPLNQRSESSFPDQMLPYSAHRNHCLISGIQLLCLYLFCKENPDQKDIIIDKLLSTTGVYNEFTNWLDFIQENEGVENTELEGDAK